MVGICEFCADIAKPDESVEIHIADKDGISHAYTFHNTIEKPCIQEQLDILKARFNQSAAQA